MLIEKSPEIYVYHIDNTTFDEVGILNKYDNLMWETFDNGMDNFEFKAPVNDETLALLKKGRIICPNTDKAGIINIINIENGIDGRYFHIKGTGLEHILTTRIIHGTANYKDKQPEFIMRDVVNKCCVSPTEIKRKIPFLIALPHSEIVLPIISIQRSYKTVFDFIQEVCELCGLGFRVKLDRINKRITFEVTQGKDLTTNQNVNLPVELSTELNDILQSSYYYNSKDEKNVAYVYGEGEGTNRKSTIIGQNETQGFERLELYVNASDLQREYQDESGTTQTLTEEEYIQVLQNRGKQKLSELEPAETFEANIRNYGSQYVFGKDFTLGDKVTVKDLRIGIELDAVVSSFKETITKDYTLEVNFGFALQSISTKIKNMINET